MNNTPIVSEVKNNMGNKGGSIRNWDDAIADTRTQILHCTDNERMDELRWALRAFEQAKHRGDRWPGGN